MAEFLQQCGSWGVLATLAAYAAGVWVNRKTGKALFNPLLMGSIFVIVFLSCFGVPYADYKSSAQPISWLLMPSPLGEGSSPRVLSQYSPMLLPGLPVHSSWR